MKNDVLQILICYLYITYVYQHDNSADSMPEIK
jgi:hypothetical protein